MLLTKKYRCDRIFIGERGNMKTIYAFTLESDDYHSSRFRYDLRLIAFLLYDKVAKYYDDTTALIINSKIKDNKIHSGYSNNEYYLDYDEYNEKNFNYEPFLIGNKSFALTIDNQIMDETIMCKLMDEVMYIICLISKVNYSYSYNKNGYLSKDREDEKNRKKAIFELKDMIDGKVLKRNELVRRKTMNISMFGRKISLF